MASKCPKCDKTVYFAEKVSSLGKDWHRFCLRCEHCSKTLTPGGHAEHDGKPFCHKPCYATLFGPKGETGSPMGQAGGDTPPSSDGPGPLLPLPVRSPPSWKDKHSPCLPHCGPLGMRSWPPMAEGAFLGSWGWLRGAGVGRARAPVSSACPHPGVNIGGAGSYIYEKPSAEKPQVTGPIEVPVARTEERKASGPPKGPSKASSVTTFTGEPNMCPRCNKRVYFAEKVTSLGKDWHRPCLRCERCGKTLTPGGHAEHDGQPYCHKPCYGILFGPKGVNTGAVGSYIYDKDPEGKAQP
ncbi:cysteine-rich protein 2 isoform X1 [Bos indicus x Bos taurus]|uniref:cysteine-rich protein 2 isoform X1 n=1 Tax=Bos indicus x Bos taurus TaxID=30522 RepID=UPI000F7D1627|nr:cysteine-rich protein 2 isoform X1 [Bos indicus x Bos taurus]